MRGWFAGILRGESTEGLFAGVPTDAVCRAAEAEGVLSLLANGMASANRGPVEVASALRSRAQVMAVADLVRERELKDLLSAFDRGGVRTLLFKGGSLAYTHYRRPDLRPRLDSDILITPADKEAAERVLAEEGYEPVRQFSGDLVTYQAPYVKSRQDGVGDVIDLHWRLTNPQAFSDVLAYRDLLAEAEPISGLGPAALGPCAEHALLIACMHRVAHHAGTQRLIWLYDIHLLATRLVRSGWDRFTAMAVERGVAAICVDGLQAAARTFGTTAPDQVYDQLARTGSNEDRTARYLSPGRRHAQTVAGDFWGMPTWRERVRLVHQHAFPSKQYMREVYAPGSGALLPVLYVRRAVRGARRWLSRS